MTDSEHATANFRERMGDVLDALRARQISVHCITSVVAAERTANTLLALGVRPSLTIHPDDIGDFVAGSDALLINMGMSDPLREATIPRAIAAAKASGRRWVLDPVFSNVAGRRRAFAEACLKDAPDVLKCNSAESGLIASAPAATTVVVTGAVDRITHATRHRSVSNGDPMAGMVTATGCALGAVIAACLAVEADPVIASAAALSMYGIAQQQAAARAPGQPGSFGIALIDALAAIDRSTLLHYAKFA